MLSYVVGRYEPFDAAVLQVTSRLLFVGNVGNVTDYRQSHATVGSLCSVDKRILLFTDHLRCLDLSFIFSHAIYLILLMQNF